jgi:hypothetical protein
MKALFIIAWLICAAAYGANRPPIVTAPEPVTLREMDRIKVDVKATDPDGNRLRYVWTVRLEPVSGSTIVSVMSAGQALIGIASLGTPMDRTASNYDGKKALVECAVSDGTDTVTVAIPITIRGYNRPPELVITGNTGTAKQRLLAPTGVSVDAGKSRDPDGSRLDYQWELGGRRGKLCARCIVVGRGMDTASPSIQFPPTIGNVDQTLIVRVKDGMWVVSRDVVVYLTSERRSR